MKTQYLIAGASIILLTQSPLWATPTENTRLRVLPAGNVVIDGKINDWDLSGGIFASDDVENQRDRFAVWMHAMYDSENLYILARFRDETPLNNPGQTIADYGWNGDCLQFRTITGYGTPDERVAHWTSWQGRDGQNIIDAAYGKGFNEGSIKDAKTEGAKQAFTKEADGKGYIQEISIPWKLLTKNGKAPDPAAGLRLTIEPNFTVGINGRLTLKDIFQPNIRPDRVFTFMSSQIWGPATLETKGNVAPQPVRLADGREFKVSMQNGVPQVDWTGLIKTKELPGFKTIDFTMPEDGYISLNIKAEDGTVVRQLLNSAFYTKGAHQVKWDGLGNPSARVPAAAVPAGNYTWTAITNTGIGLKLRGWANNGGKMPWDNGPGTNWGGDHGAPTATAVDDKNVYLGWNGAEAGKALLAVDFDGNVRWTNNRAGISGVKSVAAEGGIVYVLGGAAGDDSDGGAIYKLNAADGQYLVWADSTSADLKVKALGGDKADVPEKADTIATSNGKIYLSFSSANQILVLDGKTGARLKTLTATAPVAMQIVGDEKLYYLSGEKSVQVIDLKSGASKKLVDGLSNAMALTVGADNHVYVGTRDPDNQIKVYDLDGKQLSTIGRAGGRNLLGKWTPDGLRFIRSIVAAPDGKLWVAEQDNYPRRVSSWDTKTGKILKEYFGGATYGALGGGINPLDPNLMVGAGSEWQIDPATGRGSVTNVITRDGMEVSRFAVANGGRLYLAVASQWAFNPGPVTIFERLSDGQYKKRAQFSYEGAKDNQPPTTTKYWADANGDEKEQPEEVTTVDGNLRFSGWYMNLTPSLTLYVGKKQLKVTGFTKAGAPLYDLTHPVPLAGPEAGQNNGALGSSDDKTVVYNGDYGADRSNYNAYDIATGKLKWSYPDNFVGVHGSHNATPPEVGMIRGAYDITGTAQLPAPIGNIWVIPTNVGEWHILTEDGFYLTRLFQGDPFKQKWPDTATPGAVMDNVPSGMGGEDFGGSISYGQDKKLYIQSGKTAYWNLEVTGLDTVKAMNGGKIAIAAADLPQAESQREAQLQQAVGKKLLIVKKMTPGLKGNLNDDFNGQTVVSYQKTDESGVRSTAAWDDTNLYLAWDVNDNTPWQNAAKTPEEMYIYGDTVDFQMGTDPTASADRTEPGAGDLRISIGNLNGANTAVIYRKVSAVKKPKSFSSGVIKDYPMDYVDVLKDANITVVKRDNGYVVEAAIPLATLGLKPAAGQTWRGDFGVTHGGPGGERTRLRSYWNNQKTGLVDDAVFELKMEPQNWGEFQFTP